MRAFTGRLRIAFLAFFISHIPITISIDAQAALPLYPQALRDLVAWYCSVSGDVLMMEPHNKVWFSSIVLGEVMLQLPFFFVAVHMMYKHGDVAKSARYPRWFQKACLVYGSHVATTLIPINGTLLVSSEMSPIQKMVTITIYSPYWIFPLLLVWYAWEDDAGGANDKTPNNQDTRLKKE
ncbi:unnamed protein product [Cylindrotheca closterium]|uniref:EXPERA domain-containing protein n=1 Tax=Cylindrotheca closterium TaxID=2856 RepID=A0AAD2CPS6_9STRA|nr:unnamed protein product [Cylindrotheca closterium]